MKGAVRDTSEGRPGVMISQSFQTVERVAGEMGLPKWGVLREWVPSGPNPTPVPVRSRSAA